MEHYIYKITNLLNGREYIGVRSFATAESDVDYYGSGKIIQNVIRLEGRKNFKKEILMKFDTRKKANIAEMELITKEWIDSPQSYNIGNNRWNSAYRTDIWNDYRDAIRTKYLDGGTLGDIGRFYNCDKATIGKVVADIKRTRSESNKLRYTRYKHPNKIDLVHLKDEIINLYESGISTRRIYEKLKHRGATSGDKIAGSLKEWGVKMRTHQESQAIRTTGRFNHPIYDRKDEIIEEYLDMDPPPKMSHFARINNCDSATMQLMFKNEGLIRYQPTSKNLYYKLK